jgi:hypothetical protein
MVKIEPRGKKVQELLKNHGLNWKDIKESKTKLNEKEKKNV